MKSIGCLVTFQLIEYADNLYIPDNIWDNDKIQMLIELGTINIILVNDFYSFKKEVKESEVLDKMFNAVPLISRLDDLTIDQSLEELKKMISGNEKQIFELEDQILSDCVSQLQTKALITRINYVIGGNYKAHTTSDRYTKFNQ